MIRRARREDIPLLMELWQASFGDCMEYISFFFKNRFSPEKTFLYEESGRPVAMLFLLDAAVQCRGEPYTARYLYAACTAQAQRGRGLMRSLIDFAALTAAEEGADCIALVPASPGLFHYYAACGFYDAFYCKTVHFSRKEAEKTAFGAIGPAHALTAAEMAEIRSSVLHGWDHLVWDEAAVHYALNEHFATGGCALCIQTAEGEKGYCLYQQQEESCFAQEFIASERAALPLLSALVRASGARRYSLRLPIGMCSALSQADTAAFGMLCPLSPRAEQLPVDAERRLFGAFTWIIDGGILI